MKLAHIKIPQPVFRIFRHLPKLLCTVLWLLVLWQLAGLLWQMITPWSTQSNLQMPTQWQGSAHVSDQALRRWFLNDAKDNQAIPSENGLTLTAIITGENALAVFSQTSGGNIVVPIHHEIGPGRRLVGVFERKVEIEQSGKREQILLPLRDPDLSGFKSVEEKPVLPSVKKAPVEKAGAIYIDRNALLGSLQQRNVADWGKGLSSYHDEGILIENVDQQPLAKVLQLRNGDVIRLVNRKKIKELQDISRIYYEVSNSPALTLTILRDGAQQVLSFRGQP